MLSRSLLARSSPLRLSGALNTRVCSCSFSSLRLSPPPSTAVIPSGASLRRFSAVPAFRTESQDSTRTRHEPSGICYIANIPYKVTAEQLTDAFSEFGKVSAVRLLTTNAGLSRGVGFVQFESVADAVNLVKAHIMDPIFVLDRQLFVEHAQGARNLSPPAEPSDTLMVHKFRGDSEAGVRAMFGSHADSIMAVRFNKRDIGQPMRKAFVQFRDVNMATEAMDAFRNENENTEITYARQRQTPDNTYTLTSRLSQHRAE